ncbi:MAG: alpha/beta hydrolase [Propionibacteriales bacterium]|nr:alpha/beta hydrolase [Propionibacteriales bacterium]
MTAPLDIVLVPGLWLNGATWRHVTPALEAAGHRVTALALPGMASKETDRSGITVADHVAAVVAALDVADSPVLLVAHSAGCGIAHAALDARPDKVVRVVHVGGFPGSDGEALLPGLPAKDGEVPMPDWAEMGEQANIVDFDADQLAALYADAIPVPERVVTDPVRLTDERRYAVPATMVCPEYTAADLQEWVAGGDVPELTKINSVSYVDLPGGHWPQTTQPDALATIILEQARR